MSQTQAKADLQFLIDSGIDEIILDQPVTARQFDEIYQNNKAKPAPKITKEINPIAPLQEIIAYATDLASSANNLEELEQVIRGFEGCVLKKNATNTVIYEGIKTSDVMIIGEAPGASEDLKGVPFCGESGQLLDKALGAIGLSRQENCYITNIVYWRPPGNRKPTEEEIAICKPFIIRQIELFQPKIIMLLGATASCCVMDTTTSITRLRKSDHIYQDIPIFPMFHPSYLLRQPDKKRDFWNDLQKIQKIL